jgi:hypothetical protein
MITIDNKSIEDFLRSRINSNTYHDYENGDHQFDAKEAISELAMYFANLCELLKLNKEQVAQVFNVPSYKTVEE